jgi:transposase
LRRKNGKKPGGQPGQSGSTLMVVDDPDERLRHEPGPCAGRGAGLAEAHEVGMERRQVFDLPPMSVRVSEHQLIARRCRCGAMTSGVASEGVTAPVRYGPRITTVILYLYIGQFLSKNRTAQVLAELFGTPVSDGTVVAMTQHAANDLDDFLSLVTARIAEAKVARFDKTGLRVAGALHWVHCARTDKPTTSASPKIGEYHPTTTARTRHPRDQTQPEDLRLPPHPHRNHTVLRDPQLPLHGHQARQDLLRHPRHARQQPLLATCQRWNMNALSACVAS